MATALTFTQNPKDQWEASFIASGERVGVEVNRSSSGPLIVLASIDGLSKQTIHSFSPDSGADIIFEVDVPAEIEISIISFTEVTSAKVTGL